MSKKEEKKNEMKNTFTKKDKNKGKFIKIRKE